MTFAAKRLIPAAALVALGLTLQGCMAAAAVGTVAGTAIGVTGAVVGTTAKVGGKAVVGAGKAIIPGDSSNRDRGQYDDEE